MCVQKWLIKWKEQTAHLNQSLTCDVQPVVLRPVCEQLLGNKARLRVNPGGVSSTASAACRVAAPQSQTIELLKGK